MKLLILDTNLFKYKLHHKTSVAEEIKNDLMQKEFQNSLVIFAAVEDKDNGDVVKRAIDDIFKIAIKNNSRMVIINPFAHLSSNLAKPNKAIKILDILVKGLQKCSEFKTERIIFGWYKEFTIDVKGYNNSQIFREY